MSFSALQGAYVDITNTDARNDVVNDGLPVSVKWKKHEIAIIPTSKAPAGMQSLHIRRTSLQGAVRVSIALNGAYVFTPQGESFFSET